MRNLIISLAIVVMIGAGLAVAQYTPVTIENPGTISGNITYAGTVALTMTDQTVTNGYELTVAERCYVLTGSGEQDNGTNTITLANASDGVLVTLVVAGDSTNLVSIADSGIAKLSGAWLGDNNDSITLLGDGTNWVEVGQTDN